MTGGWRIERVARTGSTNRDVVGRARAGEPAGLVIVAGEQTEGRGRQGRRWIAAPGAGLLFTALRRPASPASEAWRWTLAAGLAARAAVAAALPPPGAWLKWPNDVLVGERKVAGVLCELLCTGDRIDAIAVGVGINLAPPAGGWPGELAGRATSISQEAGAPPDAETVLSAFLDGLAALEAVPRGDLLDAAAVAMAPMIGRRVRVEGDPVPLWVAGLADNGALLVVDEGGAARRLLAGDVHLEA